MTIGLAIAAALVVLAALLFLWWRSRRPGADDALADGGLESTGAVVLAHGFLGFDSIGVGRARQRYFRGVREGLERAGVPTYAARVAPLGSVPERADQLAAFVEALPHRPVTIVAHSMGGLDARYAISKLGLHDRVDALITIGTPHRGTALADLASTAPARHLRRLAGRVGLRTEALDWLTSARLEEFNREVADHPDVEYYSVVGRAAVRQLWRNPLLLGSHWLLRQGGGDNDGLVTVDSQRWGETLEEIDADHFAQVGWSLRFRASALYIRVLRRIRDRPVADRHTG